MKHLFLMTKHFMLIFLIPYFKMTFFIVKLIKNLRGGLKEFKNCKTEIPSWNEVLQVFFSLFPSCC